MERLAGRIILLWGWRRLAAAFAAGALLVLTQAPYDFFAAGFVSFPVLVWLLDGATAEASANPLKRLKPAFAIGWWFGFGYFLAGLWWIGGALLVEAESFAWALPLAVVGIPLLMAFFYGFATAVARILWGNDIGRIAALAFGFGLAEWLRSFLFTGFPWNPVGLAAMPTPLLMQSVAVTSVTGMNALAVFVFAMPALLAAKRNLRLGMVLAAVLIAAHAGFGYIRLNAPPEASTQSLAVRIVQPSIDLSEKWDDSVRDRVFQTTMDLSARPPEAGKPAPQLILWPETAVPFFFTERPDALAAIGEMLKPGQMLVTGTVREESERVCSALLQFRHRDRRQRRDRRRGRQGASGAVRRIHPLRRRGGAVRHRATGRGADEFRRRQPTPSARIAERNQGFALHLLRNHLPRTGGG